MRWSLTATCLLLAGCCLAAEITSMDAFNYRDVNALSRAWEPMEGTPPAQLMPHGTKQALKIPCPFATAPAIEYSAFDHRAPSTW